MTAVDERIAALLRDVPDFPKPGILFKDIAPLLADPAAFTAVVRALGSVEGAADIDVVAGIEARGFLIAGAVADRRDAGLVPVRKAGKLPPPTVRRSYELEYGTAELEVPVHVLEGKRVLLVDDVLATGGTLRAAADLLAAAGAQLMAVAVILEIEALGGRAALADLPPLTALLRA
jgi:adenine phosphoribosyltransferase